MDAIAKVNGLLGDTESNLVQIAGTASAKRDYDLAGRVLAAAQTIKRLQDQFVLPDPQHSTTTNGRISNSVPPKRKIRSARSSGSRRKAARVGDYPRFFKNGNRLVKVGWSKTDKAEYEHKCPRGVLSCLISSCLSVGGSGRQFSMDEILPLADPTDGSEFPAYQVYVALAWLRSLRLIEQHGRQGYSIRKGMNLSAKVDDAWNGLS